MNCLPLYQVVEIIDRYETVCIPEQNRTNRMDKVRYIQTPGDKTCNRNITVSIFSVTSIVVVLSSSSSMTYISSCSSYFMS